MFPWHGEFREPWRNAPEPGGRNDRSIGPGSPAPSGPARPRPPRPLVPSTHDEDLLAIQATALAEGLASFLKAYFIYPPNNSRVGDALEECMRRLGGALAAYGHVRFAVTTRRIEVAGVVLSKPASLVVWLADMFRRTGLGAIELRASVRRDDLREFAEALRRAVARVTRDPRARDLWSVPVRSIELEETRLRGRFAPAAEDASGPAAAARDHDEPDPPAAGDRRDRNRGDSRPGDDLVVELAAVESIAQRLAAIEAVLGDSKERSVTNHVDVLEQILRLVPPDTRRDFAKLVWTVEAVLGHVLEELRRDASRGVVTVDELRFRRALLQVGYGFFGRRERRVEEVEPPIVLPGGGQPGDELITEDLDLLLEELQTLPDAWNDRVVADDSRPERVAACLYEIATRPAGEAPRGVREELAILLASPDPDVEAVVRAYLDPARGDAPPHVRERRVERVLDFLEESAADGLAERVVDLSVEVVERRFPERFGLFLDSIDLDDPADRSRLVEVVTRLGRHRIHAARTNVLRVLSSSPRRLRAAFTVRNRAFLPLAEVVLARGDRRQVAAAVAWLRRLDLPGGEAAVLLLDEPPRAFLQTLCAQAWDGLYTAATTERARTLLRAFVETPTESPDGIERRTLAVYALWKLWTDDLLGFVRRLRRGRGLLGRGWPPAPIRQAAKEVLRWRRERKA